MSFDAIIFDCDGVLVDSETLAIKGEREALMRLGLHYTPEEYVRRFVGMHDRMFFDHLRADYLEAIGRAAPEDFEDRVLDGRRREMGGLQIIEGADLALREARKKYTRLAVASSSRAHFLKGKLERMGLYDLAAPHVYSADLVANGKPHPDIFLYAAEKLGAAPARCLVLEDSANGVKAGRAAGMTVWGFTGGGHCYAGYADRLKDSGAHRIIAHHHEFLDALGSADASFAP